VKISLVFEPDPDLGTDPLDEAKDLRSQGIFIDSDKEDVLLMHRRYGEQYEGGNRTDIYASGIWENLDIDQVSEALDRLQELDG
jgi:hypothetical protein